MLSGPGQEAIRPAPAARRSATTRGRDSAVKPVTLVGVALIIVGVLALAYQGITYTTLRESSGTRRQEGIPFGAALDRRRWRRPEAAEPQ